MQFLTHFNEFFVKPGALLEVQLARIIYSRVGAEAKAANALF